MLPERVCVPALIAILPLLPLTVPLKVPVALVMVRALPPSSVVPVPNKLTTVAPEVLALMSKFALLVMLLELAMLPDPDRAKVPALMVVAPSKVLILVSVRVPAPDFVSVADVPAKMAPIVIGLERVLLIVNAVPVNDPVVLKISPELIVKLPALKLVLPKSRVPPATVTSPPLGNTPPPESTTLPALITVPPV